MATVRYGEGICEVDGYVKAVQIDYEGSIEIDDKTPDGFEIFANEKRILIFPIGSTNKFLTQLFSYVGNMKIKKVLLSDEQGSKIFAGIKPVLNVTEYIDSKSEDMTLKSEEMNAGYSYGREVKKTRLKHNIVRNLHTSDFDGELYLEDGTVYRGYYHIHKEGGAMTGGDHEQFSKDLFYKRKDSSKLRKTKIKRTPGQSAARATTRRSGGY